MGGRDKHNTKFSCGAFCGAKYEIRRRRKARAGKNSFPPTPSFLPARASGFVPVARSAATIQFLSKNVRAELYNSTKIKIPESLILVRLFDEIRTYFERN